MAALPDHDGSKSPYKQKVEITEAVMHEIGNDDPDNPWKYLTLDRLLFFWWHGGRSGSGFRLSESGRDAFEYAKIEKYNFSLEKLTKTTLGNSVEWMSFVRDLNNKMKCPYYIGFSRTIVDPLEKKYPYITLYDDKIATTVALYGDIFTYLDLCPK